MNLPQPNSFGQRVQQMRLARGLTVRQLADMIDRSAGYVSRIEVRGERPSAELLIKLGEELRVDPEELVRLATEDVVDRSRLRTKKKFDDALALYRRSR